MSSLDYHGRPLMEFPASVRATQCPLSPTVTSPDTAARRILLSKKIRSPQSSAQKCPSDWPPGFEETGKSLAGSMRSCMVWPCLLLRLHLDTAAPHTSRCTLTLAVFSTCSVFRCLQRCALAVTSYQNAFPTIFKGIDTLYHVGFCPSAAP